MKSLMKTICSLQWFREPAYDCVVAVILKQHSWGKGCPGPVLRGGVWAPLGMLWGRLVPACPGPGTFPSKKWPMRLSDLRAFPDELRSPQPPIWVSAGLTPTGRLCAVPQQAIQGCAALGVKEGAHSTSQGGYGGQLLSVPMDWALIQGWSTTQECFDLTTVLFSKGEQVELSNEGWVYNIFDQDTFSGRNTTIIRYWITKCHLVFLKRERFLTNICGFSVALKA